MTSEHLKPNIIIRGALFPEAIQVIEIKPTGGLVKLIGTGVDSNQTYQHILDENQIAQLEMNPEIKEDHATYREEMADG